MHRQSSQNHLATQSIPQLHSNGIVNSSPLPSDIHNFSLPRNWRPLTRTPVRPRTRSSTNTSTSFNLSLSTKPFYPRRYNSQLPDLHLTATAFNISAVDLWERPVIVAGYPRSIAFANMYSWGYNNKKEKTILIYNCFPKTWSRCVIPFYFIAIYLSPWLYEFRDYEKL